MFPFTQHVYSQQEYWDMLPISEAQREEIIADFIKTNKYDKLPSPEERYELAVQLQAKEKAEENLLRAEA